MVKTKGKLKRFLNSRIEHNIGTEDVNRLELMEVILRHFYFEKNGIDVYEIVHALLNLWSLP